jgi:hypothetical protein
LNTNNADGRIRHSMASLPAKMKEAKDDGGFFLQAACA